MTAATHESKWRNFASWSVAGGLVGIVFAVLASWIVNGIPPHALFERLADPKLALVLLFSMLLMGLVSRDRPFGWRNLRNFVIWSAVAGTIGVLALSSFRPLAKAGAFGTMHASQWTAASVGAALLFFAVLISLSLAVARRGWTVLDAEQVETLRERGRLTLLSMIAMALMGLMLILLGLAGPKSLVSPAAALAGLLVLLAAATLVSVIVWRLMDELDRTLSYETGNMGFYLVLLLGGGWAMLAHLGFVPAAAPLDWVTMLILLTYAAGFIVMGRRKLLSQ